MAVRVQVEDFDVGAELEALAKGKHGIGGVALFVGLVRDLASGEPIGAMELEHYPGMTETELESIEAEALSRWPLEETLIVHRYGRLEPGDRIVLAAAASAHREAAFEACRFIMDFLKTRAPFWKKEDTPDGGQWVDARSSDDDATRRWVEKEQAAE